MINLIVLAGALTLLLCSSVAMAEPEANYRDEARHLVQQFGSQLKPALVQAMREGGPVHAIDVCAVRAPAIAAALSASSGWEVRRISLKPRNAETALPDPWAAEMLATFDRRYAAGESAASLETDAVLGNDYRYLKAQPVEPLCLTCHGKNLAPGIVRALAERYPDDRATGYGADELRGAFYLKREAAR